MADMRRGSEWERLWAGARLGRIDIVERLAPKWARFAPIHENNQTALMVACEAGQVEAAKTLLPWSNPDAMEPGGRSFDGCCAWQKPRVRILDARGVQPRSADALRRECVD